MVEETGSDAERDDLQAMPAVLDMIERIAADPPTKEAGVATVLGVALLRAAGSTELY